MPDDQTHPRFDVSITVVGLSRLQRDGLFGFLTVAMAAALVRGLVGADTATGRLVIGVIFGILVALVVGAWIRVLRKNEHLEVSDTDILLVSTTAARTQSFQRSNGEQLRFVAKAAGRVTLFGLYQPGSDTTVLLHLFSRNAVQEALLAHSWRLS